MLLQYNRAEPVLDLSLKAFTRMLRGFLEDRPDSKLLRWPVLRDLVLVFVISLALTAGVCANGKTKLIFSIDQGFGNGIVAHNDQVALKRVIEAVSPLKKRYDVYLLLDPMVRDKVRLKSVLDTIAASGTGFVLDAYTSDAHNLGGCTQQNQAHDVSHGIPASLDELRSYRKRYGKMFGGLRFMEVFAHDFTLVAARSTNPEWKRPEWVFPEDGFYSHKLAAEFVSFAQENSMFVEWSDWHWAAFAPWDKNQPAREESMARILRKCPGTVVVTYANNEPNEESEMRRGTWQLPFKALVKDGAAGFGLSDQSWLDKDENEYNCPVEAIVGWAKEALEAGACCLQFESAWWLFRLPPGTYEVTDYTTGPAYADRGSPRDNFTRLRAFLLAAATGDGD